MATDNRNAEAESKPAGPGDEEWDKAQAVIDGKVSPTAPGKTADGVEMQDTDDK